MFINLSNHPSTEWSENQKKAAMEYGEIVDLPFPNVNPDADEIEIEQLAKQYYQKIMDTANGVACVVHPMGEMCLAFALISLLLKNNIVCLASTSKRHSVKMDNNTKKIVFDFVKFRKYKLL